MTRQRARSLAGVLAVVTLLGLIVADTVAPTVTLSVADKWLLISLISALLGVDIVSERLSPSVRGAVRGAIEGFADAGSDQRGNGGGSEDE
jgi:hypothetical protein